MKIISLVLLLLFAAPLSWGDEKLFSFLREHQLGSKASQGKEGMNELPDVEILGQRFSVYLDLDSDKTVRRVGLYLRSNGKETPAVDMKEVFGGIRNSIVSQSGEAEAIEVPNFEDATERTGSLFSWKNKDDILILEKIDWPRATSIDILHSKLDDYTSDLGADTGAYLLPRLEAKSGVLRIPVSATTPTETKTDDPGVEPDQKRETKPGRGSDQEGGEKAVQADVTSRNEESDSARWPFVVGAIMIIGVGFLLLRKLLRGRAS
jgi:hypothetical protein